jgi:hypothetical protein
MDGSDGPKVELKNGMEIEKALCEYDQALEVGHHTDTIIHEVTAIVWGANTLLLGFILEVPCKPKSQILVIVAAVVGVFMSVYVPWVHHWTKKSQRIAYGVCRQIETELSLPHRLHTTINEIYPKWRPGLKAVWLLTVVFVLAWVGVLCNAFACLCRDG